MADTSKWKMVPAGWVTEDMVEAADKAETRHLIDDRRRGGRDPQLSWTSAYIAMVDAAPTYPGTDDAETLRTELQLTRETNLAVVRRLQARIDALEAELKASRKAEASSQAFIDHAYEMEQYHADNLAAACGGYGGERI